MQLQIRTMSNDSQGFYQLLGPLMGSRKVEKEVGIRLYDDSDKEWYTAWIDGAFVDVASVRANVVSDCYVKPQFRYKGAMTAILRSILKDHPGKLTANCTAMSRDIFERAGFEQKGRTKNFFKMEIGNA